MSGCLIMSHLHLFLFFRVCTLIWMSWVPALLMGFSHTSHSDSTLAGLGTICLIMSRKDGKTLRLRYIWNFLFFLLLMEYICLYIFSIFQIWRWHSLFIRGTNLNEQVLSFVICKMLGKFWIGCSLFQVKEIYLISREDDLTPFKIKKTIPLGIFTTDMLD